jgi:hypothetical protein
MTRNSAAPRSGLSDQERLIPQAKATMPVRPMHRQAYSPTCRRQRLASSPGANP